MYHPTKKQFVLEVIGYLRELSDFYSECENTLCEGICIRLDEEFDYSFQGVLLVSGLSAFWPDHSGSTCYPVKTFFGEMLEPWGDNIVGDFRRDLAAHIADELEDNIDDYI